MQIVFLGVGEACDEYFPNTSLLVRTAGAGENRTLLLDCGFTVPPRFFREVPDPEELDMVWISHFHGDHFFGLPLLLLRLREMKRTRPLMILGQEGIGEIAERTMELAYPGFIRKLPYAVHYVVVEPETMVEARGLTWRTAENEHGRRSLSVRLDDGPASLFYSGDGRPTPETLNLARGSQLVVHESYAVRDVSVHGHGSAAGCIDFARRAGVPRLALVHFQRDARRDGREELRQMIEAVEDVEIVVPELGDRIDL
jgi:ribonuclease BN (tRNA processing enzyme)